jgi:hypothetical protein
MKLLFGELEMVGCVERYVFLYLRFSSKYFSIRAMHSSNARWSLIFPDTTFQL